MQVTKPFRNFFHNIILDIFSSVWLGKKLIELIYIIQSSLITGSSWSLNVRILNKILLIIFYFFIYFKIKKNQYASYKGANSLMFSRGRMKQNAWRQSECKGWGQYNLKNINNINLSQTFKQRTNTCMVRWDGLRGQKPSLIKCPLSIYYWLISFHPYFAYDKRV